MNTNNSIVLYQREGCPYCQLVRKKLGLLGLSVLLVQVEKESKDREELFNISGQRAVPVLVDNGEVVNESSKIITYLEHKYGKGGEEPLPSNDYGLAATLSGDYEEIIEKAKEALKKEGFGVLTEIDVKQTLKKKLDVDVPKQIILGACNPNFAHQALQHEEDLGLLLPCNVVVRETGEGQFQVSAVNPLKLLSVVGRDDLMPYAVEVRNKLSNAVSSLS